MPAHSSSDAGTGPNPMLVVCYASLLLLLCQLAVQWCQLLLMSSPQYTTFQQQQGDAEPICDPSTLTSVRRKRSSSLSRSFSSLSLLFSSSRHWHLRSHTSTTADLSFSWSCGHHEWRKQGGISTEGQSSARILQAPTLHTSTHRPKLKAAAQPHPWSCESQLLHGREHPAGWG